MTTITVSDSASLNIALRNAQAGDTILVSAGTYSGVSVRDHEVAGSVTVASADPSNPAVITDLTLRRVAGYTFQQLEVLVNDKSPKIGAVSVFNSSNITFDRMNIHGSLNGNPHDDGIGMHIDESANVKVTNSEFQQLFIALRHEDSQGLIVRQNNFHDIRMDGVRGGGSSNVDVQYNFFTNFNRIEGDHSDAVQFYTSPNNPFVHDINVSNNLMVQGTGTEFQGVFVRTTTGQYEHVNIANNLMLGGDYHGIMVEGATDARITNNTVVSREGQTSVVRVVNSDGVSMAGNSAKVFLTESVTHLKESGNLVSISAADSGMSRLGDWLDHNLAVRTMVGTSSKLLQAGSSATEAANADTVTAAGSTTLSPTAHNLVLTGTSNAEGAGNALDNRITGNAGSNKLYGYDGNDTLEGGAGDDTIDGGAGVDTVSYEHAASAVTVSLLSSLAPSRGVTVNTGGAGTDRLYNVENITGSNFDDNLTGDNGANVLVGGAGADKLAGKEGADVLWGGTGADMFVYSTVAEAVGDKIMDFSHAEGDVIDLRRIDANASTSANEAFSLVSAFTHKAGQLVVSFSSDHYVAQGDVNGDGVADFAINIYSKTALVSSDFLF